MHSTGDYSSSPVPAFLHKLWALVEDESTNDLIAWDPSGRSFHVFDQGRFSKEVLPLYFKHSNIASFIRQLNMYGFHKVTNVELGGLKTEKDDMEFSHQFFQRGKEHLLENIKRKVASSKGDDVKVKHDDVNKVLMDVHQLKGKQETINSKFDILKRENEALWREVASLRQKHHKQQQIVNKLIQFLITIVGNRSFGGLKRPALMAGNASDAEQLPQPAKMACIRKSKPNPVSAIQLRTVSSEQPAMPVTQPLSSVQVKQELPSGGSAPRGAEHPVVLLPSTGITGLHDSKQPTIIVLNSAGSGNISDGNVIQTGAGSETSSAQLPGIVASFTIDGSDGVMLADGQTASPKPIVTEALSPQNDKGDTQPIGVSDLDLGNLETGNVASGSGGQQPDEVDLSDPLLQAITHSLQTPSNTTTIAVSPHHETVSTVTDDVDNINESLESLKDLLAGGGATTIDPGSVLGFQLDRDTLHGLFTPEGPVPPTPESLLKMDSEDNNTSSPNPASDNQLVQYVPAEDFGTLFDLDLDNGMPYDSESSKASEESSSMLTPSLDLTSPLAQRRKNRNVMMSHEDID